MAPSPPRRAETRGTKLTPLPAGLPPSRSWSISWRIFSSALSTVSSMSCSNSGLPRCRSAFFIISANSFMQQPVGFVLRNGRAEMTDFFALILNPNVQVVLHETRLASENALEILRPYDIVVDGTDNFPTRYLVNDACVLLGKPNVYGSIFRFEGQASVFAPHLGGPCYRCLYPEPPPPGTVPSCAEAGVLVQDDDHDLPVRVQEGGGRGQY